MEITSGPAGGLSIKKNKSDLIPGRTCFFVTQIIMLFYKCSSKAYSPLKMPHIISFFARVRKTLGFVMGLKPIKSVGGVCTCRAIQ
jgi:hypothetical protein